MQKQIKVNIFFDKHTRPDKNELKQAVKTPLNTLYDDGDAATGMFAVWTGQ